jgi:uncharacterized membrane protein
MSDQPADHEELVDRLELQVGRVLEGGILLSSGCLAVGLAMWIVTSGAKGANALLTLGLILLMLTPLARVVASLVAWIRLRDWFFVATTVMVFVVLIAAWLLKS